MSLVPLLLQSLILSTCFSLKDENRTGGGENLTVSLFLWSLIVFQVFWWLVGAATPFLSRFGFLMKVKPLPEAPRTKKPLWKMTSHHVDCLRNWQKSLMWIYLKETKGGLKNLMLFCQLYSPSPPRQLRYHTLDALPTWSFWEFLACAQVYSKSRDYTEFLFILTIFNTVKEDSFVWNSSTLLDSWTLPSFKYWQWAANEQRWK